MPKVREVGKFVQAGEQHNSWTVLGPEFAIGQHWLVVVRCKCGTVTTTRAKDVLGGGSKGCYACYWKSKRQFKHRHRGALYDVWRLMLRRCYRQEEDCYDRYGGRGVTVCDQWRESFDDFADWALANGYGADVELDRQKNELGYGPDNCRWVTSTENQRNRRNNRILTAFGESKPMSAWAEDARCLVVLKTLANRIYAGWEVEAAISTPAKAKACVA